MRIAPEDRLRETVLVPMTGAAVAALAYILPLPAWLGALALVAGFSAFFRTALRAAGPWQAAASGLLFGLVFHCLAIYWMFEVVLLFGAAARFFGTLLVGSYMIGLSVAPALVLGILRAVPARHRQRAVLCGGPLTIVAAWSLVHRGVFGFPWLAFGDFLLDGPLQFWIGLAGANWAGALLLLPAAALALLSTERTAGRRLLLFAMSFLVLCGAAFVIAPAPPGPRPARPNVGIVALNFKDRGERVPPAPERLGRYMRHSRELPPVDVLFWPESAADENIPSFAGVIRRRLDLGAADLVIGAREEAGAGKYNVLYEVQSDEILYRKRRLVPFTEYVPGALFQALFERFELTIKNNDILTGSADVIAFNWREFDVYPLVCYEVAYPELLAGSRRDGFILNAGNETWFATGAVRRGTLRQARSRAAESGLTVVRAVTGGYSGFIDPYGRVDVRFDADRPFTRKNARINIYPAGRTLYSRLPLAAPGIVALALLALLAVDRIYSGQAQAKR